MTLAFSFLWMQVPGPVSADPERQKDCRIQGGSLQKEDENPKESFLPQSDLSQDGLGPGPSNLVE